MIYIRSFLFNIYFFTWTYLVSFIFYPKTFQDYKSVYCVARWWANGVILGLKYLCGITHEIRGLENIPKDGSFIIASKHQSAWDTVIFLILFHETSYVLKQELLSIPLFGKYLKSLDIIAVDRDAGSQAIKKLLVDTKVQIACKRPIVIFPEGTRTEVGASVTYQPGVAMLYTDKEITVPFIPVALNSGLYWSRNSFLKKPGKIILEILPAVPNDLGRKEFMKELHDGIEKRSQDLVPTKKVDKD